MNRIRFLAATLLSAVTLSAAHAAETVSYSYDAKGRLIRAQRSGGPGAGVATDIRHDRADNRRRVTTTGSPPPP